MGLYNRSKDSGHNVSMDIKSHQKWISHLISGSIILRWIWHPKSGQSSKMWSVIPKMDLSFGHRQIITKVDQSESVIPKLGLSSQKWVCICQSCQIIFTLASLITCTLEHITFATLLKKALS